MAWTQEEISHVYKEVKSVIASVCADNPNWSAPAIKRAAKIKLKYRFGYRDYRGWRMHGYGITDKKYKRFIKPKYYAIGLPSKEMIMLDKMIDNVIGDLGCNDNSFAELDMAVQKVGAAVGRAKSINSDCEAVVAELDKICNYLENGDDTDEISG